MSEETTKKQETKGKQAAKKEAEAPKTVMYIGPSIKNVVATGTLYNKGLPEKLKQEIDRQPVLQELLIPVDKLAEAQKELASPGSGLAIIYQKIITG